MLVLIVVSVASAQADPLSSWNDGPAKQGILIFVQTVTDRSSPLFVPPEQRIATFDNDGTLWSEQPMYFQLAFALDRVRALAPKHPEWKTRQPFKAVLDGDMKAVDGKPVLRRQSKIDFIDDGPGKPVGIQKFIGRRPLLAFGNSDGDQQMLQWTAAGEGARFMGIVHHTDDVREWAYDRQSHFGRLDKALDEARGRGWTVVDMKTDWKKILAFE